MPSKKEIEAAVWAACPNMQVWTNENGRRSRRDRPHKCKECPSSTTDDNVKMYRLCFEISREIVEPALIAAERVRKNNGV